MRCAPEHEVLVQFRIEELFAKCFEWNIYITVKATEEFVLSWSYGEMNSVTITKFYDLLGFIIPWILVA